VRVVLLVLPQLCLAVVLIVAGSVGAGGWAGLLLEVTGAVLVLDVVLHRLPWRVPRSDRSAAAYWGEVLCYLVPLAAVTAAWSVVRPAGASADPDTLGSWGRLTVWLLAGVAVGTALTFLAPVNLRALRSGDLAFLAGPLRPDHAAARTTAALAAPVVEEVVFRGVPAALPGWWWIPALVLGNLALVCRHHLVRGGEDRAHRVRVRHEVRSAVLFSALLLLSGSVWPAVVAHLLGNVPAAVLDAQRAAAWRRDAAPVGNRGEVRA
jgi:hypothetical protein